MGGGKILLARYITGFDCGEETPFWHVIKESPFNLDEIDKKYQKNIRRALERCEARRIDKEEYEDKLWTVTEAAYAHYENADNEVSREQFLKGLHEDTDEYWGAFVKETGELAGWMSCENNDSYTETKKAKYHPELQRYRPSDVLHYAVLTHYLNDLGQQYVTSGTRNINHKTNVQEYKIRNWHFRKAYCYLHVEYKPLIKWIVKGMYPFRAFFELFDGITIIHQINALLLLEQLARECERQKKMIKKICER